MEKHYYYISVQQFTQKSLLLSYKGTVNYETIAKIGRHLRKVFEKKPKISRKLFAIFVELAQNIAHYSLERNILEKEECVGTLMLAEEGQSYVFVAGNLLKMPEKEKLKHHCQYINSLSYAELRQERVRIPETTLQIRQSGAGIGLLKVALFAESTIEFEAFPFDADMSFVTLSVRIDKHN